MDDPRTAPADRPLDAVPASVAVGPGSGRLVLPVRGMTCASCVSHVERALAEAPGVQQATVNLATESAAVVARPGTRLDAAALRAAVRAAGYDVATARRVVAVEGMTCATCVATLEAALAALPGVLAVSVNLASERATLDTLAGTVADADVLTAVAAAGYRATLVDDAAADARAALAARDPLARQRRDAVLALALAAPLLAPMLLVPLGFRVELPVVAQALLATVVQFGCGRGFYAAAARGLRARIGNMDLLVVLGTLSAWGLSMALWWAAGGTTAAVHDAHAAAPHLYFESAAVVIALVLTGRWLEARARRGTSEAIRQLAALRPARARVQKNGAVTEVALAEVRLGDRVIVWPGERLPVDGIVRAGAGSVDESMLTGESLPVDRQPGEPVRAGTLLAVQSRLDAGAGQLVIETTGVGGETLLARIIRLVEDAQAAKPPIQRQVDRVAAVFVPAVVVIAVATLAGWLLAGAPFDVAVIHAVTVLVIACPCALGLATPAAIIAGTGAAARHGILIRDAAALEGARQVDVVVFDKTGTLTEGRPRVTAMAAHGLAERDAWAWALALNDASAHPLADALRRAAAVRGADAVAIGAPSDAALHGEPPPAGLAARVVAGKGVQATTTGEDAAMWRFGAPRWLADSLAAGGTSAGPVAVVPASLAAAAQRAEADGQTLSWLFRQRNAPAGAPFEALAVFAFADTPRAGAGAAVQALHARGVAVHLLSGDHPAAVAALAAALGIERHEAQVSPRDKAARVAACKVGGHVVAMVGDGINDAPALAAADVGIAMGGGALMAAGGGAGAGGTATGGSDIAMQAAGITLMQGDPRRVVDALDVSAATVRKIRQNLFWAFVYNAVGLPLAAFGLATPMLAGAAMALSSVSVVGNALLLTRWRPRSGLR